MIQVLIYGQVLKGYIALRLHLDNYQITDCTRWYKHMRIIFNSFTCSVSPTTRLSNRLWRFFFWTIFSFCFNLRFNKSCNDDKKRNWVMWRYEWSGIIDLITLLHVSFHLPNLAKFVQPQPLQHLLNFFRIKIKRVQFIRIFFLEPWVGT